MKDYNSNFKEVNIKKNESQLNKISIDDDINKIEQEILNFNVDFKDGQKLYELTKKIEEKKYDVNKDVLFKLFENGNNAVQEKVKDLLKERIIKNYKEAQNKKYCLSDSEAKNENEKIFEKLIFYLNSDNTHFRNMVFELLCNTVDYFIDDILVVFENANENIKIYLCQILGFSKNPKSINLLKIALLDKNENIKHSAINSLADSEINFDVDFLVDLLKTENQPWISFSIMEAINKKGSKNILIKILPIIKNLPDYVKIEVLEVFKNHCELNCLFKLIENANVFSEDLMTNFNRTIIDILNYKINVDNIFYNISNIKSRILIDFLINVIKTDKNPWNISQAIKLLSNFEIKSDKEIVKLLKENVQSYHPLVKATAIEALSKHENIDFGLILDEIFSNNE